MAGSSASAKFPKVQLIDLDAAMGIGTNDALVRQIAARLPCRVGGGVRSVGRAQDLLEAGAKAVIVGSAFFDVRRSAEEGGVIKHDFARALRDAVGLDRVIGAVDAKGGRVVIHGWKTTAADQRRRGRPGARPVLRRVSLHARRQRRADAGHGHRRDSCRGRRDATQVTAAGGITTREEIDALDALGIDAVVGMAIYTGLLDISADYRQADLQHTWRQSWQNAKRQPSRITWNRCRESPPGHRRCVA